MAKIVTIEEAHKEFLEKYNNGKVGKHISLCLNLINDYKDFCYLYLNRKPFSTRLQDVMVKDMMENMPKEN